MKMLETIKRKRSAYSDGVSETALSKTDEDWLVKQAEKAERYEKSLLEIANSSYGLREVMVNIAKKALRE
jgi:hypothetical protein